MNPLLRASPETRSMSPIILFLIVILAIVGWWLSRQGLMAKPWLEVGVGDFPETDEGLLLAPQVGLWVFLAVVGSLFALITSTYLMRVDVFDLRPLPVVNLLWLNTILLVLSSLALQSAKIAADGAKIAGARAGLLVGGILAAAFLAGQLMAWQRLSSQGYLMASNPVSAFFYLITGLHGLHIFGGMVALFKPTTMAWCGSTPNQMRSSVGLCATYWHFLLVIWLLMFALLIQGNSGIVAFCRALLG